MTPSTLTVAASTTHVRPECRRDGDGEQADWILDGPRPAIPPTEFDAVLAGLLDELEHPVDSLEARRILLGCLQDLSGCPAGALPELTFRLLQQRMSAAAESSVPPPHDKTTTSLSI